MLQTKGLRPVRAGEVLADQLSGASLGLGRRHPGTKSLHQLGLGLVGSQLDPLYSLTKGGVTLFTKSTALEFGRKGYRIRVNSVHPGVIDTDMGQQTFAMRARALGTNDTEATRKTSSRVGWLER